MAIASGSKASPWLYGSEARRQLRVSQAILERMAEGGQIRRLKIPGVVGSRYSREDVAAIVASGTTGRPTREGRLETVGT